MKIKNNVSPNSDTKTPTQKNESVFCIVKLFSFVPYYYIYWGTFFVFIE